MSDMRTIQSIRENSCPFVVENLTGKKGTTNEHE